MLLETLWKTTVRIINGRMSRTIKDKGVLKGNNFAGLPGDSTSTPIQIMNNIIKEAREKRKELWVLLQDMKKAFDSVSLFMLKLAIEKIKILPRVIEFLLDLYENQKIEVITAFGNSREVNVKDGID